MSLFIVDIVIVYLLLLVVHRLELGLLLVHRLELPELIVLPGKLLPVRRLIESVLSIRLE